MRVARRALLAGAGASLIASRAGGQAEPVLTLAGQFQQGGFVFGRTWPRALIFVDGEALTAAGTDGLFVVGFDRDAPPQTTLSVRGPGGEMAERALSIEPGVFPSTRIDGLPPSTVEPSDPALLARIQQEIALKTEGFASRAASTDFRDGLVFPLDAYRVSSAWGSQRVLNGTPARPHYGVDLAAPAGTPIRAPADGLVTFSQPDMHFEGGLTLIDHGQGLITAYLHQSAQMVLAGRRVARGDVIGQVGATGRATGPHLCWRMRWRDRQMDPTLMVGAQAPDPD